MFSIASMGQAVARRWRHSLPWRRHRSLATAPAADSAPDQLPSWLKPSTEAETIATVMELLGLSNAPALHKLLGTAHKHILTESADDIRLSFELLRSLDFTVQQIQRDPQVLAKNVLTIRNHVAVLEEIGFGRVDIPAINRFVSLTNRTAGQLKRMRLIAADIRMPQRLADYLHLSIDASQLTQSIVDPGDAAAAADDDSVPVKKLRRAVISAFLREHLAMSGGETERVWRTYGNLRNKSLRSIWDAVEVCEHQIGMDRARIKAHPYVLYADAPNVRQILELGTLGGIDARELLWRRPKIMMTACRRLLQTQQVIREFGVPDTAYPRCVEIFTLGPRTIYERLCDLRRVKEFDVLVSHPRVLRLVQYQTKARARLEYLHRMKVNCVSLHVLSSGSRAFERYARTGVDRTKGMDVMLLLQERLRRPAAEIRAELNRHPNWRHVPAAAVKQVLVWLLARGYSEECIYANVQLLLYPIDRIEAQFEALRDSSARWGIEPASITAMQRLQMCLYLIELEYHFEGDGVWREPLADATAPPVVGDTEFDMLGDYRKTLGPIRAGKTGAVDCVSSDAVVATAVRDGVTKEQSVERIS